MRKALYWVLFLAFMAVCVFFMVHNAYWLIGDESIVMAHTGMGKPFSLLGMDGMIQSCGRLYPFAYTLYNVLLLFFDGYIPVWAHYALHAFALVVFAGAFSFLSIHILNGVSNAWKYAITLCVTMICVFRVYPEFVTCYTGVWIVFLGLSLFLLSLCKFFDTEKWRWAVVALLSINYIIYCYETVFVIPLAIGICSLLFDYKKLSRNKKLFSWLLLGSGVLFLLLYVILVLPNATNFYHHEYKESMLDNAVSMFLANKLYWMALVVLVVRIVLFVKHKAVYSVYDSLLLASFAYFCGAAVLRLNFVYYYNVGALVSLAPVLYFLKEWIKPYWVFAVMLAFAAFYGRKFPAKVKTSQEARIETNNAVTTLAEYYVNGSPLYWYAPAYEDASNYLADNRNCQRIRLELYLGWLLQKDVKIVEEPEFVAEKHGIWLFPCENYKLFPEDHTEKGLSDVLFETSGIKGFVVQ